MENEVEEGDVFLCTVDRIIGTTVFVKIHLTRKDLEGSIVFSEIAPGRIRNIRNYVVPKKKIVCKVLRISPSKDRIDLSLRRVTQKEKKEVIERDRQERSYKSILKSVLGEKTEEIIQKINQKYSLNDFIEKIKEDPKELEKILEKKDAEKILEIINSQKQKKSIIKKEFSLTTNSSEGILAIKKILEKYKEIEINYISAGRYSIKYEAEDIKHTDKMIKNTLSEIEKEAKKNNIKFTTL